MRLVWELHDIYSGWIGYCRQLSWGSRGFRCVAGDDDDTRSWAGSCWRMYEYYDVRVMYEIIFLYLERSLRGMSNSLKPRWMNTCNGLGPPRTSTAHDVVRNLTKTYSLSCNSVSQSIVGICKRLVPSRLGSELLCQAATSLSKHVAKSYANTNVLLGKVTSTNAFDTAL